MSSRQLDELFMCSAPGPIPNGEARGTAIVAPRTPFGTPLSELIRIFCWKGKTFDGRSGVLTNRITPFGINAIRAQMYIAPSRLDGKDCIVLDYSKTSLIAHWIRDEIRQVAPHVYLGVAYWAKRRLIKFSLEFTGGTAT
jgi:hypothetical protein